MTSYTKVPNALLEKLCLSNLSSADIKVILTVIRYTCGFNRNEAELSASFIAQKTALSPTWVKTTVNKLIENSVIFAHRSPSNKNTRMLSINSEIGQLCLTGPLTDNGQPDFTDNGQLHLTQENKYINKTINKTNKAFVQNSYKENTNSTFDPEEFFLAAVEKSRRS